MNVLIPKDHISFTSSKDVEAICAPLFNNFALKLFVYNRSYFYLQPGDKQGFALFSHPEWTDFFFTNDYHHRLTFAGMETFENVSGYRLILTSLFPENEMLRNLREYYNIDHGIIVAKQYKDYCEWCTFAADKDNTQILHFYINQFDKLITFIAYFKSKAKHIIRTAEQQRISFPEVGKKQRIHLRDEVQDILWKKAVSTFAQQTRLRHYSVAFEDKEYEFTAREMDCLYYLRKGYSAKKTAQFLAISPRTIEHYLVGVRNKLGCVTKDQIVDLVGDKVAFYRPYST